MKVQVLDDEGNYLWSHTTGDTFNCIVADHLKDGMLQKIVAVVEEARRVIEEVRRVTGAHKSLNKGHAGDINDDDKSVR